LKNYLRRKLGVKVDVVSKEFLNKHIKDEMLKEAIPV
jgi:predicted nucleotidyltransferase